jgi:hypothetical protein
MASTYTANSGIEKPGSGEQSGTWGTTTNTNFDIIDRVLNGVGSITLSGTTHTLSTSDGALSDGHYKVLVLGGSPSGANTITISPNDQDKLYFVYNNTSQNAVFSQGSGANVTVPNGDFAILYADGAGSGAAVTQMTFDTAQLADSSVTSAKIANGTIATADLADDAITSAKIADDAVITAAMADNAVTSAIVDHDVQTKSGTASVTLSSTAVSTYVKHSGTGTLSIGAGQYDGQTINITTTGTMTLSWHGSSQGVSLGSSAKIASGVYDSAAGYWFFSETVV